MAGLTVTASNFIEHLLQPHMKSLVSYTENSSDSVRLLQSLHAPPNTYLFTLDIESLHTNISFEQAVVSFKYGSRITLSLFL